METCPVLNEQRCPGSSAPQSPLDEVDGLGLELKGHDKLIWGKGLL